MTTTDYDDTPAGRRQQLADALRNPAVGRPEWDFRHGCNCAFWEVEQLFGDDDDLKALFDLPNYNEYDVFGVLVTRLDISPLYGKDYKDVTPEDVAAALLAAPYASERGGAP